MQNRAKSTNTQETPRRFLFDQSFDVARKPKKKASPEAEKPPEPTFSQQELEAARQDGYEKGHQAGVSEAATSMEAEIARLVAAIGAELPPISAAQEEANRKVLHDGARLASTIARKILPTYVARHGTGELEALVIECLHTLIDEPKIAVQVAVGQVDTIKARLDAAVQEGAFDGRFLVDGDDSLGPSDCRIRWQGGGLERREAEIWREIDGAVARYLGVDESPGQDGQQGLYDLPADEPDASIGTGTEDAIEPGAAGASGKASPAPAPVDQPEIADPSGDTDPLADAPPSAPAPVEDR